MGHLTLPELSVGMILFTVVMVVDIFAFGEKMRKTFLEQAFFGRPGKLVLLMLGLLICAGWFLVAYGVPPAGANVLPTAAAPTK